MPQTSVSQFTTSIGLPGIPSNVRHAMRQLPTLFDQRRLHAKSESADDLPRGDR
jgi:hypothetical protein